MKFELTKHAQKVMAEREIPLAWVERTYHQPELCQPDENDATVERRFRKIPEYDDRVLRVVVNTTVEPNRVVSVYFDRQMKGKI